MRITKFLTVTAAIGIAIAFYACKGDTGPAGPAGTNGNANVSVTTYIVPISSWTSDGSGGWKTYLTPAIDPTQGAISVLYSVDNTNWIGLPFTNATDNIDVEYIVNPSQIEIDIVSDNGNNNPAPSGTVFFKVSLIPPAIMVKHPSTNWNNAAEVAQLPEVQAALQNKQ